MKLNIKYLLALVLLYTSFSSAQNFIAGVEGAVLFPYSGLADRFKGTQSFAVFAGKEVSEQWTWTGKLEYFKYSTINEDKNLIKRKIMIGSVERDVTLSLQDTTRELQSVGLSANADYKIFNADFMNVSLGFGFGIYRWEHTLGSYHDTLTFKDDNGSDVVAEILKIPSVKQVDWSGGFNAGVNINFNVYGPVWINAGANYKNIVGELWAVLSLDMENVSSLQMFQTKAGIFVKL